MHSIDNNQYLYYWISVPHSTLLTTRSFCQFCLVASELVAPGLTGSGRTLAVEHKRSSTPAVGALATIWTVVFHKDQFSVQSSSSATRKTLSRCLNDIVCSLICTLTILNYSTAAHWMTSTSSRPESVIVLTKWHTGVNLDACNWTTGFRFRSMHFSRFVG